MKRFNDWIHGVVIRVIEHDLEHRFWGERSLKGVLQAQARAFANESIKGYAEEAFDMVANPYAHLAKRVDLIMNHLGIDEESS